MSEYCKIFGSLIMCPRIIWATVVIGWVCVPITALAQPPPRVAWVVFDENEWVSTMQDFGSVETLSMTAENIARTTAVQQAPGIGDFLCEEPVPNCRLTFQASAIGGLGSDFSLLPLQPGAPLSYADTKISIGGPTGVGGENEFEDDDFALEFDSSSVFAVGVSIADSHGTDGEKVRLYDTSGVLIREVEVQSSGGKDLFFGIVTTVPIGKIEYDEDAGLDDIFLRRLDFVEFQTIPSFADIALSYEVSRDPVPAGGHVTFTATALNLGPSVATRVNMVLVAPQAATFVGLEAPGWDCVFDGNAAIVCNRDSLGVMDMAAIDFTYQAPTSAQVLLSGALAGAAEIDWTPGNNADNKTTTVSRAWGLVEGLAFSRGGHAATLLPSGEVLISGGCEAGLTATEIFDPSTATFREGAPLSEARCNHSATLLPSGQVLLVGGESPENGDALSSSEIYDPSTDLWSLGASLSTARSHHTATLLPNGRILIAGGMGSTGILPSAEIFTAPNSALPQGSWSDAAPMTRSRSHHTATLLPDGRVLLVGGQSTDEGQTALVALAETETYDSVSDSWQEGPSLTNARFGHTATLYRASQAKVLVVGGRGESGETLEGVEAYSPDEVAGTWASVADLSTGRVRHTATLLPSGEILVSGGFQAELLDGRINMHTLAASEVFNPLTEEWQLTSDLSFARFGHSATVLSSGHVLLVGGQDGEQARPQVELYLPAPGYQPSDVGLDLGAGAVKRLTMTLLPSGRVLLAGGRRHSGSVRARTRLYIPAPLDDGLSEHVEDSGPAGAILSQESMRTGRDCHTATLLKSGEVVVVGGLDSGGLPLSEVEVYAEGFETTSALGSWRDVDPVAVARGCHSATLLPSGEVLVIGGLGDAGEVLASVERYDPNEETWSTAASLLAARAEHTATLLPSGEVLVTGGTGQAGALDRAEIYDPQRNVWREAARLGLPRSNHAQQLLPSGRVLVVGGREGAGAELYDANQDSWRPTAEQPAVRSSGLSLTLLLNGQVLLVGTDPGTTEGINGQIYDPMTDSWNYAIGVKSFEDHAAVLLPSGNVLITGGISSITNAHRRSSNLYFPQSFDCPASFENEDGIDCPRAFDRGRPSISGAAEQFDYNISSSLSVTGTGFRGISEGGGSSTSQSAVNFPIVQLTPVEGGVGGSGVVTADPAHPVLASFWEGEMSLDIADLPPVFHPGWHRLTVFAGGVPSVSRLVRFECSLEVGEVAITDIFDGTGTPVWVAGEPPLVPVGGRMSFEVATRGGRLFQWQKNFGTTSEPNWIDIPGADDSTYTTPLILGSDSGSQYRVVVGSGCRDEISEAVTVTVLDTDPPEAAVVSPDGGEYWVLDSNQLISYEAFDPTTWICEVRVSLLSAADSQGEFVETAPHGPGGLPAVLGEGQGCLSSQAVQIAPLGYSVPSTPPAGSPGSAYKIRIEVIDHVGNRIVAESDRPFFIVPEDDGSVRTLILSYVDRMSFANGAERLDFEAQLDDLANYPLVAGRRIVLEDRPTLVAAYQDWDLADMAAASDPENEDLSAAANLAANRVLFGPGGLHEYLRELAPAFPAVEYLVLIGGDLVIPMARMLDEGSLLTESSYPSSTSGGDLTLATRAGRAAADGLFLSDDPLATLRVEINPPEVGGGGVLYLPKLALGRLVESPEEILRSITEFQRQEGTLRLTGRERKVLVSGYDFLVDSAVDVSARWRNALACSGECVEVSDALVGGFTESDLQNGLCGDGGGAYGILNLNGHATHYLEGVPGTSHFDIRGLSTEDISADSACGGTALNLSGALVYAVGCHGGLSVEDEGSEDDHPLDLPQSFLGRGALAYLANTGYGWGLRHGVGYGERLIEVFTEQLLSAGPQFEVGQAIRDAKLRYAQEAGALDGYDLKTLQQWALFGFPMLRVELGLEDSLSNQPGLEPFASTQQIPPVTQHGGMEVQRLVRVDGSLPEFLTVVEKRFLLSAPGIYRKRTAAGDTVPEGTSGCPDPDGCYYSLNGISERGTGDADRPIQPFVVSRSAIAGTSQHGVLWKGGEYREEAGWNPIFGELISNSEDTGSNHGATPRYILARPVVTDTDSSDSCRGTDLAINQLVLNTGDLRNAGSDGSPDYVQRLYTSLELETFHYNNAVTPFANCDRQGPELDPEQAPFHVTEGALVRWQVPATDASDVWRVVVVYDTGQGAWESLELEEGSDGLWSGGRVFAQGTRLNYVLQAVDRRGNVSWLLFDSGETSSGVDPQLAESTEVVVSGNADLLATLDSPENALLSEPVVHTLTVTNSGPDPAHLLELQLDLPHTLRYIGAGGEGWGCTHEAGTVTCKRQRQEIGQNTQIKVATRAVQLGEGLSRVQVRAAEGNSPEASTTTLVRAELDLGVDLDNGQTTVVPGEEVVYTLTLSNLGPVPTNEAGLDFALPEQLLEATYSAQSGSFDPASGVWSGLDLGPGNTAQLQLRAVVDPEAEGQLEVQAQVFPGPFHVDVEPGNDVDTDVDNVADRRSPTVVALRSAAAASVGQVNPEATLQIALTQLLVELSEEVVGAEQVSRYLLVEAGPDGIHQSTSVAQGLAGDDEAVVLGQVSYEAEPPTAVLMLEGLQPLPRGRYRLLVSGRIKDLADNALDGDGDGVGGDDYRHDWRIVEQQLLDNPNLDLDTAGWQLLQPTGGVISRSIDDADGIRSSGSFQVLNASGPEAVFAMAQCLPLSMAGPWQVAAKVRIDSFVAEAPQVRAVLELHEGSDCQVPVYTALISPPITGSTHGRWLTLPSFGLERTDVISLAGSMLLSFVVEANGSGDFVVGLDNLQLYPHLFGEDFESGLLEAWGGTVP